jgi:hypothetical protein
LRFIIFLPEDQALFGVFQDSRGRIYKVKMVSQDQNATDNERSLSYVVHDEATGYFEQIDFNISENDLELLNMPFIQANYFNIYWEDARKLSEIKAYYSSPTYAWESAPPMVPFRFVLFK